MDPSTAKTLPHLKHGRNLPEESTLFYYMFRMLSIRHSFLVVSCKQIVLFKSTHHKQKEPELSKARAASWFRLPSPALLLLYCPSAPCSKSVSVAGKRVIYSVALPNISGNGCVYRIYSELRSNIIVCLTDFWPNVFSLISFRFCELK
jgi:hypothetical protein